MSAARRMRRGELPHREALQAEEVAFRDEPDNLAVGILHDDVADSAARHHHRRIAGGGLPRTA